MLSELYFYLWFPTRTRNKKPKRQLWIAFRIVFLLMIPNNDWSDDKLRRVVNCFQNCIFTYDSQPPNWLSPTIAVVNCFQNCIFTYDSQQLSLGTLFICVVNCFQNCIFTYDSQRVRSRGIYIYCCELLSELYFYLWFPTKGL